MLLTYSKADDEEETVTMRSRLFSWLRKDLLGIYVDTWHAHFVASHIEGQCGATPDETELDSRWPMFAREIERYQDESRREEEMTRLIGQPEWIKERDSYEASP